jgi:hypothetical protein
MNKDHSTKEPGTQTVPSEIKLDDYKATYVVASTSQDDGITIRSTVRTFPKSLVDTLPSSLRDK